MDLQSEVESVFLDESSPGEENNLEKHDNTQ